jgi:hypothetical protein
MNYLKSSLFIFVAFFTLLNTSNAQQFNWATTVKLKDNFYQYDIGEFANGSLLLMSKYSIRKDFRQNYYNPYDYFSFSNDNVITLVRFDKQRNMLAATPFEFKKPLSAFYEAFISDNVYFIYSSIADKQCSLLADVYTVDGKYVRTETLNVLKSYYKEESSMNPNYNVFLAENHTYMVVRDEKNIAFYDKNLKKVWETPFSYIYLSAMTINDEGTAYAVGETKTSSSLVAFDIATQTIKTTEIKIEPNQVAAGVVVKSSQNVVCVVYQYGDMDKKQSLFFGPPRIVELYADGIVTELFDPKTLTSTSKTKVPFSAALLMEVTEKKKLDKVKGLEWLSIRDVHFTAAGDPIVVLEKEYSIETATKDQYGRVTKTEYTTVNEDIVCVKVKANNQSEQVAIKRKTKGRSNYDYMFSSISFLEKDKLYILYNEGSSSYKLVNNILSSDLKPISVTETKTYSEHDVYLSLRNARKLKEGQYKIIGREGKNCNSVILTF